MPDTTHPNRALPLRTIRVHVEQTVTYAIDVRAHTDGEARGHVQQLLDGEATIELLEVHQSDYEIKNPRQHIAYVTSFSNDWEEGTHLNRTIEEAFAQWHTDMGLDEEDDCPKPGTRDWKAALADAYEGGKWKAYSISQVDTLALTIEPLSPDADMDWDKVAALVKWTPIEEESEPASGFDNKVAAATHAAMAQLGLSMEANPGTFEVMASNISSVAEHVVPGAYEDEETD